MKQVEGAFGHEIQTSFCDYLKECDLEEIKYWTNGFRWLGESVYNPFDILLFLDSPSKDFKNYWFETGTPTFLIDLMRKRKYYIPGIEKIKASEKLIGSFDIENMEVETLLFQTGYLTISGKRRISRRLEYTLTPPCFTAILLPWAWI